MSDLFAPYTLGSLRLCNRICRSATNDYMGNPDGTVSPAQLALYRELAEQEVGLIITGHACVSPDGRNDASQNAMYDDRFIAGQKALTDAVHAAGGCIVQQLSHAGGKSPQAVTGHVPGAPSALEYVSGAPARELTLEEIHRIQDDFAAAAVRAKQAGYDGVQIHCAHGYLLSEFIDPAWNVRTDAYGSDRFRMARETLEKVRAAVGPDYPVLLKIHSNCQGQTSDFLSALTAFLNFSTDLGVTAAEVSGFDFASQPPEARRYYLQAAEGLVSQTRLPLILVGGLRDREDMQAALDAGMTLASASRPFICQPDFVCRLKRGGMSACRGCYGCFRCY
ncbi:MAG: NADH:flavin oxidoreductase, partial [Butyricicoccus sp.]|nr:NADH:flavin oxidoreductase [Butyricicoccus sp.]